MLLISRKADLKFIWILSVMCSLIFGCKTEAEKPFPKILTTSIWGLSSSNKIDSANISVYVFYPNNHAEMLIKLDSEYVPVINLEGSMDFAWKYSESDSLFTLGGRNVYKVKNITIDTIELFDIKTQKNELLFKINEH